MGFRRRIQTEHAMHTLNTITSKYKKECKRTYTVFVDFSKFYDTINHNLLFQKLKSVGIFGNLLSVLKSMYRNLEYSVKLPYKNKLVLTKTFAANIGLKQGCPLSPTLANIFLHDIHKELLLGDVNINNTYINSIAWADDLVLFSLSRGGVCQQLKNLEKYCKNWHLRVNIDKTKCLIFSTTSIAYDKEKNFYFNGEILMFVSTYKYLGIEFQQNGRFTIAVKNRVAKAQAALFAIQRVCSSGPSEYPSIQLLNTLFYAKIVPILTYGSSIWAPKSNNTILGKTNNHFQSTQVLLTPAGFSS